MRASSHAPDRLDVNFDDDHLVANSGLVLASKLGHRLGLPALLEDTIDLGEAPGGPAWVTRP